MLTAKQRFALANAVRLLQSILSEDDENAAPRSKRRSVLRDAAEKRQNILRDYHNGAPVSDISAKYNLSHQYIYSIIRKNKTAAPPPPASLETQQAPSGSETSQ